MNRRQLLDSSPSISYLGSLHAISQVHEIVAFALRVLDAIDTDNRDLDEWETDRLLCALGALYADWFLLALACVERALAAEADRPPGWHTVNVAPTASLRAAFKEARFRPVGRP